MEIKSKFKMGDMVYHFYIQRTFPIIEYKVMQGKISGLLYRPSCSPRIKYEVDLTNMPQKGEVQKEMNFYTMRLKPSEIFHTKKEMEKNLPKNSITDLRKEIERIKFRMKNGSKYSEREINKLNKMINKLKKQ